jgi:uncharacterized repeat protein (TIGR03803 family)
VRKYNLLIAVFFFLGTTITNAQIGLVYGFSDTTNAPSGPVIQSGGTLYGVIGAGGPFQKGSIYSVDSSGANYNELFYFIGGNGTRPQGSLVLSGNTLFGITELGGSRGYGCIFSVSTDGRRFVDMHDFLGPDGMNPCAGLTLSGTVLYGMTEYGGAHTGGVIFSIDTDGTGYTDMLDLDFTTGNGPIGPLTFENGLLYGETNSGAANSYGCIFCIKTDGTGFRDLYDFNPKSDTIYSNNGYLTPLRNKLYGMTNEGGAGYGSVFSIDTNGSAFTNVCNFPSPYVVIPEGALTLAGNVFFGASSDGGARSYGSIFSVDTAGGGFRNIYEFDGWYGAHVTGSLLLLKDKLYGTAGAGGPQGSGSLFRYDTNKTTGISQLATTQGSINVYPNPGSGIFQLGISHAELVSASQPIIEVYNALGQKVFVETLKQVQGDNAINLSNQPNGIYLYRVLSESGNLVGTGKIEIQK